MIAVSTATRSARAAQRSTSARSTRHNLWKLVAAERKLDDDPDDRILRGPHFRRGSTAVSLIMAVEVAWHIA